MRWRYSFVLLTLFTSSLVAQNGRIRIEPAYPERGQQVSITYDPAVAGATIPATADQVNLVFTYSNLYELPYKMPLQKKGNTWHASFIAPRYATYATFTVQSGNAIDKPAATKHYELAFYQQKERVENGYLYEAYSLSAQMGKAPALGALQQALYEKELAVYPNNYEAKVRSLKYKMDQASGSSKEKYRLQAHEVIAAKFREAPGKMAVLNKVTMAYLIMGENSRLDSIRQVVRTQFPQSEVAYELLTGDIAKETDTAVRLARLQEALTNETADNAKDFSDIHEMLFDHYATQKETAKALYHLQRINKSDQPYLPLTIKKIARTLCEQGIALDTAMHYAQWALSRAAYFPVGVIRFFPETGYIPSFVDDSTRAQATRAAKGNMLSLIALIEYKKGNREAADGAMQQATAISSDQETLTNAGSYYALTARPAKAFDNWWTLLLRTPEDTAAFTAMKKSYVAANGSNKGLDDKIAELKSIWNKQVMTKLVKERINVLSPTLDHLVDLNGKPVAADKVRNKIVVIDFWATWCVPCMKEMPYLQSVYDQYKNDPRVSFLVINSGARNTLEDAKKWPGNKTYTFPVYFNPDPAIGDKFGFNVIPATYVINPEGYIQFKTIGFEGPAIEQKLSAAIGLLLSELK